MRLKKWQASFGGIFSLLYLFACGGENLANSYLSQFSNTSNKGDVLEVNSSKDKTVKMEPVYNLCNNFEVPIYERSIRTEHKSLELTSTSSLTLRSDRLPKDSNIEQRCQEIKNNFSGAYTNYSGGGIIRRMTVLALGFKLTNKQNEQIAKKKVVNIYANNMQFNYSDGEYYSRDYPIAITCSSPFEVKCESYQILDPDICTVYEIQYPDQICTFSAVSLEYAFSDNKTVWLEIDGEIKLSAESGSQLLIKRIFWRDSRYGL